jgi:hypothetical protein
VTSPYPDVDIVTSGVEACADTFYLVPRSRKSISVDKNLRWDLSPENEPDIASVLPVGNLFKEEICLT